MMIGTKNIFLGFVLLQLVSCNQKTDVEVIKEWVENPKNGMRQINVKNGVKYDLQYLPPLYRAARDFNQEEGDTLDSLALNYEGMDQYVLKLSPANGVQNVLDLLANEKSSKEDLLYYFSYRLENDLLLKVDQDVYKPILFHYERSYSVRNAETFLIGFEKPPNSGDKLPSTLTMESEVMGVKNVELQVDSWSITRDNIL